MAGKVPLSAQLNVLDAMIAGFLSGCKMHLLGTNVTIGSSTTLAAMLAAEATFTGYTAQTLNAWSAAATDGTNAAVSTDTQGQFTPTGAGGTGNVYGYFLTNSAGTAWYGGENFASPLTSPQNVVLAVNVTESYITRF